MSPNVHMSPMDNLIHEMRVSHARMEEKLEAIYAETKKTNGRVTKLEQAHQYALGVVAAILAIGGLIIGAAKLLVR